MGTLRFAWTLCCVLLVATNGAFAQPSGPVLEQRTFESVQTTFERSRHKIEAAFSKRLRYKRSLHGKIIFSITIAENGAVLQTKVTESTLNDQQFEKKLSEIIANLQFSAV